MRKLPSTQEYCLFGMEAVRKNADRFAMPATLSPVNITLAKGYRQARLLISAFFAAGSTSHQVHATQSTSTVGGIFFLFGLPCANLFQCAKKMHMLKGKGSYDKHDAHYIPVVPENESDPFCPNYYPCPPDGTPVCDELVVFQNIQTKTHFWFELQADLLYVPKASPQTVSELLDLIFQVLQEPSIKNDPQIKQALKSRAGAYLMCRGEMVQTRKDRPFLETLSALFEVKRQVNDLARQNLISIGSTPIVENPLPEELQLIQEILYGGDFNLAWNTLLLYSSTLFASPLDASSITPLYAIVRNILPSLAFREKNNLFEKILPALRRAKLPGQQLYLELDVARWFLSHREIASFLTKPSMGRLLMALYGHYSMQKSCGIPKSIPYTKRQVTACPCRSLTVTLSRRFKMA